jgi:DNA polymerase I-like protein with 3'-5' exonuclease and polymerase domains
LKLIFDIETNGLLEEVSTLHMIGLRDVDTGQNFMATDFPWEPMDGVQHIPLSRGLDLLAQADLLIGHNIIGYDIPVLRKLYPHVAYKAQIRDTIIMSRVVWPKDDLRDKDFKLFKKDKIPGKMIGAYSLQAFGYRLLEYKGDYSGKWETCNQEMVDYCVQDIEVTAKLWDRLAKENWSEDSYELETEVAKIIFRQEQHGFLFDEKKCDALVGKLEGRKYELEQQLKTAFPAWEVHTTKVAGANNKTLGRIKGQPYTTTKIVEFNPGSRLHIAGRLNAKYGWTPTEYTPDGKPKVDDEVLGLLPYPEAKILAEYFVVTKRLGQAGTGKEAWKKAVRKDGRIHGRVTTNGAVTGRMTHSGPNMAQVPGNGAPYGHECRELFTVPKGKVLVGADAAALELRCLAGYMAIYDNAAYVKTVLEGKSEDQTDIHNVNARALGCTRAQAKVWFYAFIYGAGDAKLGTILEAPAGKEIAYGRQSRARFLKNLPALGKITKKVKDRVEGKATKKDGSPLPRWLKGLDGRRLSCRSSHSAFNTLLQSAGAVLMKQALVILDARLQDAGLIPGVHYEFVGNIHDEWQIEVDEDKGEFVGKTAKESIKLAGEHFKFGCPLDGDYKVGKTWADTH